MSYDSWDNLLLLSYVTIFLQSSYFTLGWTSSIFSDILYSLFFTLNDHSHYPFRSLTLSAYRSLSFQHWFIYLPTFIIITIHSSGLAGKNILWRNSALHVTCLCRQPIELFSLCPKAQWQWRQSMPSLSLSFQRIIDRTARQYLSVHPIALLSCRSRAHLLVSTPRQNLCLRALFQPIIR